MQKEEIIDEPKYVVDAEKGVLVLNGGKDGTVSNKMIENGIKELISAAQEKGIDKPKLESIVISNRVKVLLADVFCTLGEHKDIDLSRFSLISESGDWEISPNRGVRSPFVGIEPAPKAFIFNSKIPKGMEVLRDGSFKEEGILEGVGKCLVFGINVGRIPERAFANSDASYIDINASDEIVRIGKEAFYMDSKEERNDLTSSINQVEKEHLSEDEIKKTVKEIMELIETQRNRYKKQETKLLDEKFLIISEIDKADDDRKKEIEKEISAIDDSIKKAVRKRNSYEKIGLEYDYTRLLDITTEGSTKLEEGVSTLSLHNISSDFADRALEGKKNLFISYQEGFLSELQTRLTEEKNRIDKVAAESGLTVKEKDTFDKALRGKEELPVDIKEKIENNAFDSLRELVEFNRRIREAGENGSLLLTTYGCSLGQEIIKKSGITAVVNARGEKAAERLAIDRSSLENKREKLKEIITYKLTGKGQPEVINDLLEKMKTTENQIKSDAEKLGNIKLKDKSLSGAEYLSAVDIDTDGSTKDLLKDSGKASGGILFPGEKKIVQENGIERVQWKAEPLELIGSYVESWGTVRKMSLTDQLFDIMKNLLLLSSTGLVLGVKRFVDDKEPEVVFGIEPKLFVRDDILKSEVTFSSPADWEKYKKIREDYQAENVRIRESHERNDKRKIELATMKKNLNRKYREAVYNLFFSEKPKEQDLVYDNNSNIADKSDPIQEELSPDGKTSSVSEAKEKTIHAAIRTDGKNENYIEIDGNNESGKPLLYYAKDIQARLESLAVFNVVLKGYLSNTSGENLNEKNNNKRFTDLLSLVEENFGEKEKIEFTELSGDKNKVITKIEDYVIRTENAYILGEYLLKCLKEFTEPRFPAAGKEITELFFAPALLSSSIKNRDEKVLSKEQEIIDITRYKEANGHDHSEKIHTR